VPNINALVPASVRVELNDLLCALAHLEEFVVALAAEEIVQFAIVGAGAEAKNAFYHILVLNFFR
jgi:hypothetical protein